MARKRMIDPEFFLDEGLAKLSSHARLLYIGSWGLADDRAFTLPYRPDWIKAQIFPYERANIKKLIDELIRAGKYTIFTNDKKEYIYIKNMGKWQYIEKPSRQKYPSFNDSRVVVGEKVGNTPAESNRTEYNRIEKNIYVEVAKATFDHYIVIFNKNKNQYQYTPKRKAKVEQRVREIFHITNDIDKTRDLMSLAVDNRKLSKFHMGDNPQGKLYTDFIDHIFRSQEYTEKLIFEEKPQKPTKQPEWWNELRKKYEERDRQKQAI